MEDRSCQFLLNDDDNIIILWFGFTQNYQMDLQIGQTGVWTKCSRLDLTDTVPL